MNRLAIVFMLATVAIFNSNAQIIHCLRLDSAVVLDGNPNEWPQPFRYYDGATKLQFAFSNDTANIYVCIKVTDDQTQLRLFRNGLNVWVDPKGRKKEAIGISFPSKQEQEGGSSESGEKRHRQSDAGSAGFDQDPAAQRANILRLKQHAFLQQLTLRVKGFNGVPDQVLPLKNNYGINAAFNWDSLNTLCIEYKIPIALSLGHNLTPQDTLKPIGIGMVEPAIETHASTSDNDNGMSNQSDMGQQRGNMGGGGMGGGGMGGGGMGGMGRGSGMGGGRSSGMSNSGFNNANQEQKTWSKVILAIK